ncbi:MAG: S8 family peptidase, partial [Acidobacteriota bacterium]
MVLRFPSRQLFVGVALFSLTCAGAPEGAAAQTVGKPKLGVLAQRRAVLAEGWSRVIVRAMNRESTSDLGSAITHAGGLPGRRLPIIDGQVAYVPNAALKALADHEKIGHVHIDRPVAGAMERTGKVVGATNVREALGYDGSGVVVAVIDSGVAAAHDDLADSDGRPRVVRFVDFVNGREVPYDDYGHGTHVAGIIAGNGRDSDGARSGIAPAAGLIVLKALDASGSGRISDVISALDYVLANKDALNIRIVNLSLAASVYESCDVDPLTIAAQRVASAGIVVVAAAGNLGRNIDGIIQYGGITAPGNAPWVLTVGAASHMGTVMRSDDTIAPFSSRGPTFVDAGAKPDIVAPGVGIESLSAPDSTLYGTLSAYLLSGSESTSFLPYLSLSGTSMSAPVVSGTIALMLQANPALTPNAVKAILQFTSERRGAYDPLSQGAGFLNAKGAVALARYFAGATNESPDSSEWSHRLIWGNQKVSGGRLSSSANAWALTTKWGAVS